LQKAQQRFAARKRCRARFQYRFFRFQQSPGGFGFRNYKVGNPIQLPDDIGFAGAA
jgi:hypothetical protein